MKTLPFLRTLPPFPAVATQLMRLLSSEDVDFLEAVRLLRSDAALGAEVLRLANSALYSARHVDTILQALSLIGVERLNSLVVTLSLCKFAARAARTRSLGQCWRHNLACATLSERLARIFHFGVHAAHTAGLLHDIGRLALLVGEPVAYDRLLITAEEGGEPLLRREKELFGADHCEVGRMLAEQWRLPPEFAEIAGHHHQPGEKKHSMTALVHVSCSMADMLGFQAVGLQPSWNPGAFRQWLPSGVVLDWNPDELKFIVAEHINALESAGCAVAAA